MNRRVALIIGNSSYADTGLAQLVAPKVDVDSLVEVLRAPNIGGFDEVTPHADKNCQEIRIAISSFVQEKERDDLILLYFSGHGMVDEEGRLYLCVRDTNRKLLTATAIPAEFITREMNGSRSRRQILILDCCHSGAVGRGMKGTPGATVVTGVTFEGSGHGRVVLTATDATQYAWEGDQLTSQTQGSVFTEHLIGGLQTGDADREPNGIITVEELFDYVDIKVRHQTPRQTPRKFVYEQGGGDLVVARNPSLLRQPEPSPLRQPEPSPLRQPEPSIASRPQRKSLPPWTQEQMDSHYGFISSACISGEVVIFLGPEVNLCGRPTHGRWKLGELDYVPSRSDLAAYLAAKFGYPAGISHELMQVSQYVSDSRGRDSLYTELHEALDYDYLPPPSHRFLVKLFAALRDSGRTSSLASPGLLIITTNYDATLERTFAETPENFHLLTYESKSAMFAHQPPGGKGCDAISQQYPVYFDDGPPVIVKILGGVNRMSQDLDTYVITEDDQSAHLARSAMNRLLPTALVAKLQRSHILFLGCGEGQWSRPATVDSIFSFRRTGRYDSWSIQLFPDAMDERFWMNRRTVLLPVCLEEYIRALGEHVVAMPPSKNSSGRSELPYGQPSP